MPGGHRATCLCSLRTTTHPRPCLTHHAPLTEPGLCPTGVTTTPLRKHSPVTYRWPRPPPWLPFLCDLCCRSPCTATSEPVTGRCQGTCIAPLTCSAALGPRGARRRAGPQRLLAGHLTHGAVTADAARPGGCPAPSRAALNHHEMKTAATEVSSSRVEPNTQSATLNPALLYPPGRCATKALPSCFRIQPGRGPQAHAG